MKPLYISFCVLFVFFLFGCEKTNKVATYKIGKQLFEIDSSGIDKIDIEHVGKSITLSKVGLEWRVTLPIDRPAYPQYISNILSDLKNYNLESKVSENPDNLGRFGLDNANATKVSVFQRGQLIGSLLIGNSGSGVAELYIKNMNSNDVYLAFGLLRTNFVKDSDEWQDKQFSKQNSQPNTTKIESEIKNESKSPKIKISNEKLMNEFNDNEISANNKYKEKIIQVVGKINKISDSKNLTGDRIIKVELGDNLSEEVDCHFKEKDMSELSNLKKGQNVIIEGFCGGTYTFGVVHLFDCVVIKK